MDSSAGFFEATPKFKELLRRLLDDSASNAAAVRSLQEALRTQELKFVDELATTRASLVAITHETTTQLTAALAAARTELDSLKQSIADRDATVARLEATLAETSATVAKHSKQLQTQVDWNAIRTAELAHLTSRLNDRPHQPPPPAASTLSRTPSASSQAVALINASSGVAAVGPFTPADRGGWSADRAVELPSFVTPIRTAATEPTAATREANAADRPATLGELAETRRRIDDWTMLFGVNAMQVQAACSRSEAERLRLLHSTPAFHAFWKELFQLNSRVSDVEALSTSQPLPPAPHPAPPPSAGQATLTAGRGATDTNAAAAGANAAVSTRRSNAIIAGDVVTETSLPTSPFPSLQQRFGDPIGLLDHTPRSAAIARPVATGGGSSIFIPALGVDVAPREYVPSRTGDRNPSNATVGVMVHRVVTGSLLGRGGVAVGDTIVALNGVTVVDGNHLASLAENLPPERAPQLTILPHARAVATPLVVTLSEQCA